MGKGRPRATSKGGMTRLYTPAKTVSYESLIALFASQAMQGRPPAEGPIWLRMTINVGVPPSWAEKKRKLAFSNLISPTKKPDVDNVLKAYGDALNGVVWRDDVQIVNVAIDKRFALVPSVSVVVAEVGK